MEEKFKYNECCSFIIKSFLIETELTQCELIKHNITSKDFTGDFVELANHLFEYHKEYPNVALDLYNFDNCLIARGVNQDRINQFRDLLDSCQRIPEDRTEMLHDVCIAIYKHSLARDYNTICQEYLNNYSRNGYCNINSYFERFEKVRDRVLAHNTYNYRDFLDFSEDALWTYDNRPETLEKINSLDDEEKERIKDLKKQNSFMKYKTYLGYRMAQDKGIGQYDCTHDKDRVGMFDALYGGLPVGLTVLGARPGTGKTELGLQIVKDRVRQGEKTGFISLEMSRNEIFKRWFFDDMNISYKQLHNRNGAAEITGANWDRLEQLKSKDYPLYLADNMTNIDQVEAKIHEWAIQGVKVIVLDFIQYMSKMYDKRFTNNELGLLRHITTTLKSLSNKYELAIVCLAQLNREYENGRTKPAQSNIANADDICQLASLVFILDDRPYIPKGENPKTDNLYMYQVKCRDNGSGNLLCKRDQDYQRLDDWSFLYEQKEEKQKKDTNNNVKEC